MFPEFSWPRNGSGKIWWSIPTNGLVPFHHGSMFASGWISASLQGMGDGNLFALSMIHVSISVANSFVHFATAADQRYHAFGELAGFVYCLLQKIKKASSLPLVEQWEDYVVPNHSRFPAIDDKDFLARTHVIAALNKVGSHYLQTELRRDARRFLEKFELCPVKRGFEILHWTRLELLLPCNCCGWG